jgi:hypothetical protein
MAHFQRALGKVRHVGIFGQTTAIFASHLPKFGHIRPIFATISVVFMSLWQKCHTGTVTF